jgi:hypothetical protein
VSGERGGSGWRPEDASSSASGGHQSSTGSGPLFDALDAPLPSEIERQRRAESRTEAQEALVPQARRAPAPTSSVEPLPPGARRRRSKGAPRRVKRKLQHIDPLSVLKVSLIYYAMFLIVWLALVAVFYSFLDSLGFFGLLDDVGEGFAVWENVNITLGLVEKWAFVVGLTLVVVGSLLNLFLAFMYNVISDLVGGIEVTFLERDA